MLFHCPPQASTGLATGRALIDRRFATGNGLGVGAAARVVALAALCLRQKGVDLVDDRVGIDLEAARRPAQAEAEQAAEDGDCDNGGQHGHRFL